MRQPDVGQGSGYRQSLQAAEPSDVVHIRVAAPPPNIDLLDLAEEVGTEHGNDPVGPLRFCGRVVPAVLELPIVEDSPAAGAPDGLGNLAAVVDALDDPGERAGNDQGENHQRSHCDPYARPAHRRPSWALT